MNSIKKIILSVVILSTFFISCSSDDGPVQPKVEYDSVAYIVNYGGYGAGNGEISIYNMENETMTQDAYKAANGTPLASNIQSMTIHDDVAYLMSNAGDKIDILNAATLKAISNPLGEGITKPRYMAASGKYGYISCWGEVDDFAIIANSYIAKIELESNKLVNKIMLPGGPEGLYIKNNKLYIASTAKNIVTVMDLGSDTTKDINVSAIPQQFVEDGNGNLWVSLVSKYSVPFPEDKLGFAIINTNSDQVIENINFPGIGADGWIAISPDNKTVYALGGGNWVEEPVGSGNWVQLPAGIFTVDVDSKTLNDDALIEGEKLYGFDVNPENGDIYLLIAPDTSSPGTLEIYASNGEKLATKTTGPGPNHVVYYKIEKEIK